MKGSDLQVCDGKCDNNDNGRMWNNKKGIEMVKFMLGKNMVLK